MLRKGKSLFADEPVSASAKMRRLEDITESESSCGSHSSSSVSPVSTKSRPTLNSISDWGSESTSIAGNLSPHTSPGNRSKSERNLNSSRNICSDVVSKESNDPSSGRLPKLAPRDGRPGLIASQSERGLRSERDFVGSSMFNIIPADSDRGSDSADPSKPTLMSTRQAPNRSSAVVPTRPGIKRDNWTSERSLSSGSDRPSAITRPNMLSCRGDSASQSQRSIPTAGSSRGGHPCGGRPALKSARNKWDSERSLNTGRGTGSRPGLPKKSTWTSERTFDYNDWKSERTLVLPLDSTYFNQSSSERTLNVSWSDRRDSKASKPSQIPLETIESTRNLEVEEDNDLGDVTEEKVESLLQVPVDSSVNQIVRVPWYIAMDDNEKSHQRGPIENTDTRGIDDDMRSITSASSSHCSILGLSEMEAKTRLRKLKEENIVKSQVVLHLESISDNVRDQSTEYYSLMEKYEEGMQENRSLEIKITNLLCEQNRAASVLKAERARFEKDLVEEQIRCRDELDKQVSEYKKRLLVNDSLLDDDVNSDLDARCFDLESEVMALKLEVAECRGNEDRLALQLKSASKTNDEEHFTQQEEIDLLKMELAKSNSKERYYLIELEGARADVKKYKFLALTGESDITSLDTSEDGKPAQGKGPVGKLMKSLNVKKATEMVTIREDEPEHLDTDDNQSSQSSHSDHSASTIPSSNLAEDDNRRSKPTGRMRLLIRSLSAKNGELSNTDQNHDNQETISPSAISFKNEGSISDNEPPNPNHSHHTTKCSFDKSQDNNQEDKPKGAIRFLMNSLGKDGANARDKSISEESSKEKNIVKKGLQTFNRGIRFSL